MSQRHAAGVRLRILDAEDTAASSLSPLPLLLVGSSDEQRALLVAHLQAAGLVVAAQHADTPGALADALARHPTAAVLARHPAPFAALEALRVVGRVAPDAPFLILGGPMGEDVAVAAMRSGADDCVLSHELPRLVPALRRALAAARERRTNRQAAAALAESEARFRALSENLPGMVFQLEVRSDAMRLAYASEGSRRLFGLHSSVLAEDARAWFGLFAAEDEAALLALFAAAGTTTPAAGGRRWIAYTGRTHTGRAIEFTARAREVGDAHCVWDGIAIDITAQKEAEAALRGSREELRELASHLVRVREAERTAIARELHDDIGSTLTGIKFQLACLKAMRDPATVTASLAHVEELVDGVIVASTRLMHDLRPGIVDEGIVPALEWQARALEQRCGVTCTFESSHEDIAVPAEVAIALFRICQEALNNVAKHACATAAHVRLAQSEAGISLQVRDDGVGLPADAEGRRGHFGLRGMRERVHALGGTLQLAGGADEGTIVSVEVPLAVAMYAEDQGVTS